MSTLTTTPAPPAVVPPVQSAPAPAPVPASPPAAGPAGSGSPLAVPAATAPCPVAPSIPAGLGLKEEVDALLQRQVKDSDLELDVAIPLHLSVMSDLADLPGLSPAPPRASANSTDVVLGAGAIPEDPLARVCLLVATFMEGLNYSDLVRAVDVILPELEPEPAQSSEPDDVPAPPRRLARLPRDLSSAMLSAGIRRFRRPEGQAVMELTVPGLRPGLRQRLMDEHFGLVHQAHRALMESALALEGSPALRSGLAHLGGVLAAEETALGSETLLQLAGHLEAGGAAEGSSSEGVGYWKRVRAFAELLSIWRGAHGQAALVAEHLSGLLAAGRPELLLGVLAGLKSLSKVEHTDWLARVAAEAGTEGRKLVGAELWWRLTREPEQHADCWQALLAWSRRPETVSGGLVPWARNLVRRLLVFHAVGDSRRPWTQQALVGAGEGHEALPADSRSRAAQIVFGHNSRGLAEQLAMAVATDSFSKPVAAAPTARPLTWALFQSHPILFDPAHFLPADPGPEAALSLQATAAVAVLAEVHARLDASGADDGFRLLDWLLDSPTARSLGTRAVLRSSTDLCREFDELSRNLARLRALFERTEDVSALDRACRNLRARLKSAVALRHRLWQVANQSLT